MLEAALSWAARGFRVFPCRQLSKLPLVDEFYNVATTNPEEIRALWHNPMTGRPAEYNIGVSTDNMVVLDVDVKDGRDGWGSFERIGGDRNTLTVRTPSGGMHFYYIAENSRNRVNVEPGLDIRSHHGYVLAPGSRYVDAIKGVDGHYELVHDAPMSLVPDGIEAKLVSPGSLRSRDTTAIDEDADVALANAAEYLKHSAPPSIEGSGGNNTAYQVAARVVNDFAVSSTMAALLMIEHWNDRCEPPWDTHDIYRFADNAATYAQGQTGIMRPDVVFGTVVHPDDMPKTAMQLREEIIEQDKPALKRGNGPRSIMIGRRPWVASRMILREEITVVASMGSGGKSALALTLGAHWGLGLDFGPFKLEVPGVPVPCFIHNAEDRLLEQGRRLMAICSHYKLPYDEVVESMVLMTREHGDLIVAHAEGNRVVYNETRVNQLAQDIVDSECGVFMIDPLINVHQCNENDNAQMKGVMKIFNEIAVATKTGGLIFHHTGKGSNSNGKSSAGEADASRGAGAIVNSARIAYTMTSASKQDKEKYGIREIDKAQYTRIDDAKTNVFNKSNGSSVWLKWHGVKIGNPEAGFEEVGVPAIIDMKRAEIAAKEAVAAFLEEYIVSTGGARVSLTAAAQALGDHDPIYNNLSDVGRKNIVKSCVGEGLTYGNGSTLRFENEMHTNSDKVKAVYLVLS